MRTPRVGLGTRMLEALRAIVARAPDLIEIRAAIRPADPAHEGFFLRRHGFVALERERAEAGVGAQALEVVWRG